MQFNWNLRNLKDAGHIYYIAAAILRNSVPVDAVYTHRDLNLRTHFIKLTLSRSRFLLFPVVLIC